MLILVSGVYRQWYSVAMPHWTQGVLAVQRMLSSEMSLQLSPSNHLHLQYIIVAVALRIIS